MTSAPHRFDPSTWPIDEDTGQRRHHSDVVKVEPSASRMVVSKYKKNGGDRITNRFAKPCGWCWNVVPPHEGFVERAVGGGWMTIHFVCPPNSALAPSLRRVLTGAEFILDGA